MPEPGLVTNAQDIDLLGIGGWASDALLEQEACHAVSEESHPLDKNEETTIQAPRESQEKQNVTSTKDEIAITKGSTLVLHGKSLLDEGLFGLWLSQEFTHVLKERVVSCLEGGLLVDIVAHFPTGCGESGLSDGMT